MKNINHNRRRILTVSTPFVAGAGVAGRVFKGVLAPTNLMVPPHRYIAVDVVEIGVNINALALTYL